MTGGAMTSTSARALLLAAGLSSMLLAPMSAAYAGDKEADKDAAKKPSCDDFICHWKNGDPLTYAGITLYGTYDIGYTSMTNGPVGGQTYQINPGTPFFVTKFNAGSWNGLTSSPLEQTKVGLKVNEKLVGDLSLVGQAEIGFDPQRFSLIDGPGSLAAINGDSSVPNGGYPFGNDSSRAGEIFNGPFFGGLSDKKLGKLTYGRQNAYLTDVIGAADPMGGSAAFGLLGWTGSFGGGGGDTEDKILDNSLKYTNKIDVAKDTALRVGGLYQFATVQDGGYAWQGGVGLDYKGLSIDGVYAFKQNGESASYLGSVPNPANQVSVTVSDNTIWALTAKYDGGKDNYKLFAGYQNISQANPSNPPLAGDPIIGGYLINGNPTTTGFNTAKDTQMWWVGGSYKFLPSLTGTVAYYQANYGDFINNKGTGTCTDPKNTSGTNPGSNCAGQESGTSALLDYQIDKHWDVYGGAMYSQVSGGYSSGFQGSSSTTAPTVTSNTAVTIGSRIKF